MVSLSRFAHTYNLDETVTLIHSLRMKPVYLTREIYQSLKAWLDSPRCATIESIPQHIQEEVKELIKCKVLVQSDDEDEQVLHFIRSSIPKPSISVCYFILSEQCNLACKYCFLGNNSADTRKSFSHEDMSVETADKAIDFFIRQLNLSDYKEIRKPMIIFYGGEPLINFTVLEYIATRLNSLRKTENHLENLEMSVITNGLLLNEERLLKLKQLGVQIAISVDGFTEETNNMRVDVLGKPVFTRLLKVLDECKQLDVNISLSVTLSENTIKSTEHIFELIKQYDIKGLGFNIMMSDGSFILPQSYNDKAASFIINAFVKFRELGIYEDRIIRKLDAFAKSQVYFSDCAATSGSQIVIVPDGKVGVCHGCVAGKKYFVSDVSDNKFDARTDDTFLEWSQISPVNNEKCLDCAALGICGGGCPVNALHSKPNGTLHTIDERFCAHSKQTLEFLIKDLYSIILSDGVENEQ
ncbi:MAG: Radical domain protein [Neobacillus sp.]|jgi:uncharacterized protein|nr:Radical domain protein [Neobacillus sp.]